MSWLLLCALLALGAIAASGWPPQTLDWQPGRAGTEPWRWLTAAFAHLDRPHLLANLAGTAIVGAFGWAARCSWRDAAAWLLAWPLTHGLLLFAPELEHYAGLSGVLHAGVAVAAVGVLVRGPGWRRGIGALVLFGLMLKLLFERPDVAPLREVPGWDFQVAVLAHATGAAAGLACALLVRAAGAGRTGARIGA